MAKKEDFLHPQTSSFGNPLSVEADKWVKEQTLIAIKEGKITDPKVVEKLSGGKLNKGSGISIADEYPTLEGDVYDEYKGYVSDPLLKGRQLDIEQLNQLRFENQSALEQAGNAVGRLATNIVPQILSGAAAIVDIPGYWDAEHAANNAIVNWANDVKEWSNDKFAIYENPNDAHDFSSSAWWFSRGESLVESIGAFAVTGMGAGALVKGVSTGIKALNAGKNIGRAVIGARKAQAVGKSFQQVGTAVMMNQAEAVMEASSVYKNILEQKIAKGYSYDEARKAAADGASTTMNVNRLNIILNLTSAKMFMSPTKLQAQFVKELSLAKGLRTTLLESGQEALEEVTNHIASKKGEAKGMGKNYTWDDILKDATSAEGIEAAFLGAIGGAGQQGVVGASQYSKYGAGNQRDEAGNRISAVTANKQNYAKQQKVIEELKANGVKITDSIKQSLTFGNTIDKLKNATTKEESQTALKEDFAMRAMNAFNTGTQSILESMIDDTIADPDITTEERNFAQNAKKYYKDLENIYYNAEEYNNVEEVYLNKVAEHALKEGLSKASNQYNNTNAEFQRQATEVAKKYTFTKKNEVINKVEGKEDFRTQLPDSQIPMTFSLSNLDENTGDTKENQEVYNAFLKEVKSLPSYTTSTELQNQVANIEQELFANQETQKEITSNKYQQKVEVEKQEKEVEKGIYAEADKETSIDKLEKLREKTKDNLTKAYIDKKIATIKSGQETTKLKKEQDSIKSAYVTQVNNASIEQLEKIEQEIAQDTTLSEETQKSLKEAIEQKRNSGDDTSKINEDLLNLFTSDKHESEVNKAEAATKIDSSYVSNEEQAKDVEAQIQDIAERMIAEQNGFQVDDKGDTIGYIRPTQGHNRAAYLSRAYKEVRDAISGVVTRLDITNKIKNAFLLRSDVAKAGSKITFVVNEDYEGDVYTSETNKTPMSWQTKLDAIKKQWGVNYATSEEYIKNVPIVAQDKDGNDLFYVHESNWISDSTIENTPQEIANDKAKLTNIRRYIVNKRTKNETVTTTITKKSTGVLLKSQTPLLTQEAFPEGSATFAIVKNKAFDLKNNVSTTTNTEVKNKSLPHDGSIVAIIPHGDGQIAVPLARKPIVKEEAESIGFIIDLYLRQNKTEADKLAVKQIYEATGIILVDEVNPTATVGLSKLISQYLYLYPSESGLGNVLGGLKSDKFLITVTGNGIEFGYGKQGNPDVISLNFKSNEQQRGKVIAKLVQSLHKQSNPVNANIDRTTFKEIGGSTSSGNMTKVTKDDKGVFNIETVAYQDWINTKTESKVFVINVGTEENPEWTSTIQPTIEYDTTFAGKPTTQSTQAQQTTSLTKEQAEAELKALEEQSVSQQVVKEEPVVQAQSQPLVNSNNEAIAQKIATMEGINEESISAMIAQNAVNIAAMIEGDSEVQTLNPEVFDRVTQIIKERQALTSQLVNEKTNEKETPTNTTDVKPIVINPLTGQPLNLDDDIVDDQLDTNEQKESNVEETEAQKELSEELRISEAMKESASNLLLDDVSLKVQYDIINWITSAIVQEGLRLNKEQGKKEFDTANVLAKKLQELNGLYKMYTDQGLVNKAAVVKSLIDQFDKVKIMTKKHIKLVTSGKVDDRIDEESEDESGGLFQLNYSDEWSLTLDSKKTASANLKKFFSAVQDANNKRIVQTNSIGIPIIIPFDEVYNTLHRILANKKADYTTLVNTLTTWKASLPWVQSVLDLLENAPQDVKNEFVTDMTKHHISMEFVLWKKGKNGFTAQVWNSNSSSTEQQLRVVWKSNLKSDRSQSPIIESDDEGNYKFNDKEVEIMINQAKTWEKTPPAFSKEDFANPQDSDIAKWLGKLGIVLDDRTYKAFTQKQYYNKKFLDYTELFTNSLGLINVLASELNKAKTQKLNLEEDSSSIFNDSVIKQLAKLDARYASNYASNSFNAGTKTVYSYGNNKWLINRFRDLVETDSEIAAKLKELSFTQNSLWLNDLENDSENTVAEQMKLTYLSLEALKKEFSKSKDDKKLNQLAAIEHEVTKMAFFFKSGKDTVNGKERRRVGYFYPTTSDKSGQHIIHQYADKTGFTRTDGKMSVNDETLERMYESIILPEILRIRQEKTPDIAGYEPKYFYFIPALNTAELFDGSTLRDLAIRGTINDETKDVVKQWLNDTFIPQMVEDKVQDWLKLGVIEPGFKAINFIENSYFSEQKNIGFTLQDRAYYAAADYVLNYSIANAEMYKLFVGDPALYAKWNSQKSIDENIKASYTNLGKRLAGDVAPGMELSNSIGDSYVQVFINDLKSKSKTFFDKEQRDFFTSINPDFAKDYFGEGKKNAIEGSDAQEFTTWKEHLKVMYKLGRLTTKEYKDLTAKLSKDQELNEKELKLVLQPMKPVYAGNVITDGIDRRIYIKSSAFPLLPQFTKSFELDQLRQALEKYESSLKGKTVNGEEITVRASFNTANKVGGVKSSLELYKKNGDVVDNLVIKDENTLSLPRENFRIQQDVPYKADKDSISVGSQEMVLLFSNLLDVPGFRLEDGKPMSGKELKDLYLNTYHDLYKYKYETLRKRLKMDREVEVRTDITYTTEENSIFDKLEKATTRKQLKALEVEEGDNFSRAKFINDNFDKIIEEFAKNKINVFMDQRGEC